MTTYPQRLPCPFLVGEELCSKPLGHRGRHDPDAVETVQEISRSQVDRIWRRLGPFGQLRRRPSWWPWQPRCPACRTVITGISTGPRWGPGIVVGMDGQTWNEPSQYPVWFSPCNHEFRRVLRGLENSR